MNPRCPIPDFERIFGAVPTPFLVLAPDFIIVAADEAYLRATQTRREDIIGRPMFEAFPDNPDDPHASGVRNLRASLGRVLATREADTMPVQKYDIRRPAEQGGGFEERYWSPVNSPVLDDNGQVAYIIHRVEDVTDFVHMQDRLDEGRQDAEAMRRRIEELETEMFQRSRERLEANLRLREANDAMAALDRAKTTFFSNISHELRTPLTLMLGPIEGLLQADGLDDEQRDTLLLAHRNALRLLKLVNALLEFARVEAGRIAATYEPTDLSSFTGELASVFRSAIERAGLRLLVDCPPLPEMVYVDRSMWEKIVLNLLSNALKFTFQGEIEIALRARDSQAELTVRDTGVGIPAHELPRLFERFHRVEGTHGRSQEGAGIGLALVQELVRLHRGTIRVDSHEGDGSRFVVAVPLGREHLPSDRVFGGPERPAGTTGALHYAEEALGWLPQAVPEEEPTAGRPPEERRRPRIVLAEDNADMRGYVCRLLGKHYHVHAVADGQAALAAIQEQPPDLVVTDLWMLGMSGVELVREIRKDSRTLTLPIIILSASSTEEARIEGLQAGADDYLIKPFSARELMAHIANQLAQSVHARRVQALRAEAEAMKAHLAMVLESVSDAFVAIDRNWRITYANSRAAQESGLPGDMLVGADLWRAFSIDPASPIRAMFEAAMRDGQLVRTEYQHPPTGRWWEVRAFPSPEGIVIFSTDITERRQAEQALQESERRLAVALEAGGSAVWEMEVATGKLLGSDTLFTMLGYAPGELPTAADWLALVHDDDRPDVPERLDELIQGKRDKYRDELRLRAKDGSWRWILTQSTAVEWDARGHAVRLVGTHTDITERKTVEEEIQRLNAELEQRVQERTAELQQANDALLHTNTELQHFAHATAHDLKTPLRSIAGFAQLLQREIEGADGKHVKEWAAQVVDNTKRLQTLIDELLIYTRLENQGLPFEAVNLQDVASDAVASLAVLIHETGAEVRCGQLPTLSADRIQIGQVLQNLIENGIKYNQSKPPRVTVTSKFQEDEWVLSVADNGIGIDPRHHERIFEIFRRLHSYHRVPGTGIGLALCRRIVERHGGRIWVESRPGEGSTFYFTLPVRNTLV